MSEKNITALQAIYPRHLLQSLRFTPEDLGVRRIGHFGAFREEMRDRLWEPVVLPQL